MWNASNPALRTTSYVFSNMCQAIVFFSLQLFVVFCVTECSPPAPFHQEVLPSIQVYTLWKGLPWQGQAGSAPARARQGRLHPFLPHLQQELHQWLGSRGPSVGAHRQSLLFLHLVPGNLWKAGNAKRSRRGACCGRLLWLSHLQEDIYWLYAG